MAEGGRGRTQGDIVPHCGCRQLSGYEAVSVVSSLSVGQRADPGEVLGKTSQSSRDAEMVGSPPFPVVPVVE